MSSKSVHVCPVCGTKNASGAEICMECGANLNYFFPFITAKEKQQRKSQKHIAPILWSDPIIGAVSGATTTMLLTIWVSGGIGWNVMSPFHVWGLVCGAIGAIIARPLIRRWFPTMTDSRIISILGGVLGGFAPILLVVFLVWLWIQIERS